MSLSGDEESVRIHEEKMNRLCKQKSGWQRFVENVKAVLVLLAILAAIVGLYFLNTFRWGPG